MIVWDVARGETRDTFSGHSGEVWGLDVSSDGRTLYSAALDARAIVWDLSGDRRLDRPFDAGVPFVADDGGGYPIELALTPDGRTLALTQDDGTVDLVDTRTLQRRGTLRAMPGFAAAVDYQPGRTSSRGHRQGRPRHAVGRADATARGNPAGAAEHVAGTGLLAGPQAARRGRARPARERTIRGHERAGLGCPPTRPRARALSCQIRSGDLHLLAGVLQRRRAARRRRGGGRVPRSATRTPAASSCVCDTDDQTRSVAFSPDGRLVATGQFDGRLLLWSTARLAPVGRPVEAHEGRVITLNFSRDGRTLASAGAGRDRTAVGRGQPEAGRRTAGRRPRRVGLRGPHARRRASASPSPTRGTASAGTSPRQAWKRHACRVAGRELTAREWQDALPGRPYRSICQSG